MGAGPFAVGMRLPDFSGRTARLAELHHFSISEVGHIDRMGVLEFYYKRRFQRFRFFLHEAITKTWLCEQRLKFMVFSRFR
jgi:hypothetical protein